MLKVTVLGSGSSGNVTLISSARADILIDVGLSGKETAARLESVGSAPDRIRAILVTHEHADHIKGLTAFAKHTRAIVYMSELALEASGLKGQIQRLEIIRSGEKFEIEDLVVTPFSTPHDSADPLAFTVECNGLKISQVTDLGYMSGLVKNRIERSDCLVLESNHDVEMLKVGPYPWALKQRILSRHGHLSNDALAEFLANDFDGHARYIFLAHISKTNNHPEIALHSARRALQSRAALFERLEDRLKLTYQHRPSETVKLE